MSESSVPEVRPGEGFDAAFARIADAVQRALGVRLLLYKRATVLRRVLRRMRQLELADFDAYARRLDQEPELALALARDMLVPHSSLLRDRELCEILQRRLLALPRQQRGLQIWVPSCVHGDEVYTLAMLVAEALSAQEASEEFLVFGTGHDPDALAEARSGRIRPSELRHMPASFKRRYVLAGEGGWFLSPALLRRCVFLSHDPFSAPPFTDLDLISARNLLVFLEPAAQRRALEIFHRALRRDGLLLTGRTDSLLPHPDLFVRRPLATGLFARAQEGAPPRWKTAPALVELSWRAAFEALEAPAAVLDAELQIIEANPAFQAATGAVRGGGSSAVSLRSLIKPQDQGLIDALAWELAGLGRSERRIGFLHQGGAPRLLRLHQLGGAQVLAQLIFEPVLRVAATPDPVLELINEGVVSVDAHGMVRDLNPAALRLLGARRDEVLGYSHERVLRFVGGSGEPEPSTVWAVLRSGQASERSREERYLLARNGRRMTVRYVCAPITLADGAPGAALLIEDTTEFSVLNEELAFRSSYDPLTGLLNRDEFEKRLGDALDEAQTRGLRHVLCYLDLDQFKIINDTLGHVAGDELLREFAALFRAGLRPQDVLARLGGDEFGLLLHDVDEAQGKAMVDSLLRAARQYRFVWETQPFACTVSVGATVLGDQTENTARALAYADAACYSAKDAGRDRVRWVTRGDAEIQHRHGEMSLVAKIGKALDTDAFELYYEDVVSVCEPSRICYREILLRMRDDEGRLIAPGRFIAAAERYYLMTALDRWVFEHALAMIAQLPDDGIVYALNVSGMSLSDEKFMSFAAQRLQAMGEQQTRRVCVEITETAAITHLSEAVRFMRHLSELGCRFSLDDFGAGMASFTYLRNLPVDFLKIDGSFVRSMDASRVDRGMVEAINRIGKEMGLRTIAEHVEDQALLATLCAMGIDWAQGRAIGPTRPLADLLRAVEAGQAPG